MKTLKNKKIWITGASSGIGKALAVALAREEALLVLSARNSHALKQTQKACVKHTSFCMIQPLNLSDSAQIQQAVQKVTEELGNIDILINNAGISQRSLARETPVDIDRRIMEVNFFGMVQLTKAVLPFMLSQGSGHIVAVSSITGKFGFPLRTAYSASKHAIQGFFESLRAELTDDNIKVTIVSPGRIKTNISLNAITADGSAHKKMDNGQAGGMSPEKCAKRIVRGIKKQRKEMLIGNKEILMVYIHRWLPALYHRLVTKVKN
ncbi:SDR family oxidoreductase [Marinilabilia salmonicolor]|uniref:Short-subunit dehydrogenase n=1 Tax=Marinilabilia salmonicolor TaxID=989 RepID=A0A368VIP7_9BACT|nr:SDR family oxidoreductase [Marinilabilia salmonicolor]RCW38881.1 short-subunit dehydrogenase [Marinilabilia salmonicolor]